MKNYQSIEKTIKPENNQKEFVINATKRELNLTYIVSFGAGMAGRSVLNNLGVHDPEDAIFGAAVMTGFSLIALYSSKNILAEIIEHIYKKRIK